MRFLILAAIYAAMFWSARQLLHDERRALLAAFSPLLIPLFSWHSLSYLTHTNLLCALLRRDVLRSWFGCTAVVSGATMCWWV